MINEFIGVRDMLEFNGDDDLFVGDEILKEYGDCCDCGLCCKYFQPLPFFKEEIKEIADFLGINEDIFYKKYVNAKYKDKDNQEISLKTPCPFLENNNCLIYEHRGFVCRTFPLCINLTTNEAVLSGIYFCPQATQFYEGLLDFLKKNHPTEYKKLILMEKQLQIQEGGLKIQGKSTIFSAYLDWLHIQDY
ncbi:MAG: hypothetical protein DRN27_09045 [Thermoplasmata archaeon]|nr:MAG: hypothetical protein DRN27_09045 [Thermoplasmata archaeon]